MHKLIPKPQFLNLTKRCFSIQANYDKLMQDIE